MLCSFYFAKFSNMSLTFFHTFVYLLYIISSHWRVFKYIASGFSNFRNVLVVSLLLLCSIKIKEPKGTERVKMRKEKSAINCLAEAVHICRHSLMNVDLSYESKTKTYAFFVLCI